MSAQFEENSVLKLMKNWEYTIKHQPKFVENDEDLPEDIKEEVLRIRHNLIEAGIDINSLYLVDFDIGGSALAVPNINNSQSIQLYIRYDNIEENENEKSSI